MIALKTKIILRYEESRILRGGDYSGLSYWAYYVIAGFLTKGYKRSELVLGDKDRNKGSVGQS